MQTKFLRLYLLIAIGASLTACSSNHIVEDNKPLASTIQTQVPKKIVTKRVKKKVVITKKVIKKTKTRYTKRVTAKPKYKKKPIVKRYRTSVKKRVAQKRVAQRRYNPRNRPVYRKQRVQPRRYTAVKRGYTPRRKPTYKKRVVRPRSNYRKYAAKPRSNYRRKAVKRITPRYRPKQRRNYGSASFAKSLSTAAVARTRSRVRYDGRYVNIKYPWGDVPSNIGVCTDVVIRSYRRLGIDLQKAVHEDMANGGFYDYPNVKKWGLSAPDKNIDHRRVYNLQAFFRRHGAQLPITHNPNHYKPGDIVSWMVGPNLPHIGIVVEQRSTVDPRRHMIVHNISRGPEMEDILFRFRITGHYRYNKNNRLVAPRRFAANKKTNAIQYDYQKLMRELSRAPVRKKRKSRRIQVARSRRGISDEEIRAVLGK
ncbi:MAG: DUF1287 domain-containing protein [Cocleimonas sp.]|nr:DUF1287 domain-containing protein [Cocleimonas sp.]